MRPVGPGFQFRMGLGRDKEGMLRQLAHLHDASVRGQSRQLHALFRKHCAVIVVDFLAVPVPLMDRLLSVQRIGFGRLVQYAGIRTEAQRPADIFHTVLIRHQGDNRMGRRRI